MKLRYTISAAALLLAAGCSQGSSISSPGSTSPGTGVTAPTTPTAPTPTGPSAGTCPDGFTTGATVGGVTTCEVGGQILADTTLSNVDGIAYKVNGRLSVGDDVGATDATTTTAGVGARNVGAGAVARNGTPVTLTIEPGTTIVGESGADFIVVNRGSRIVAEGTETQPIVFTSQADLDRRAINPDDTGGDNIGEWGGLVILGQAPINRCATGTPGGTGTNVCENVIEGIDNPNASYGGTDPADDSGILKFVQVRFAGFEVSTGNELNGITFGGVGSGTTVENIQVHNNSDDGVEFFGGNVNVKNLVLTGNDDDSIDTDNGYQGNIQFALVVQRANGGDNIVEASSAGAGVTPSSDATIANFTFIGNRSNAFRLNTGTIGTYLNGVVDYGQECFRYQDSAGDATAGFTANADPAFDSVLFDCDGGLFTSNSDTVTGQAAVNAGTKNVVGSSTLVDSFFPGTAEAAAEATFLPGVDPFFETASYLGAFGPTETPASNWATGWTFGLFDDLECPTGTVATNNTINGVEVCRLTGAVTTAVTLTRGFLYEVDGRVSVGSDAGADGADSGASLTIDRGVTLYGDSGSDFIVVNRGGLLNVNGTQTAPVIMTSLADVQSNSVREDAIGEWGGLVILGSAPINRCATGVPNGTGANVCENVIEGISSPTASYGGTTADDSSGSLRYLQVKHAGFEVSTGNELNGITFGGVGDGTTVEYVQVHNNSDDGVEFFGGGVDVKYLVLTGNDDDSIDTDNGYNGSIQYAIVSQRPNGGDNIVEASSAGAGVTPSSDATIANFTFLGSAGASGNGLRMNTGTIGTYVNGVVDTVNECFRWQDSAGDGNADGFDAGDDPAFDSVLFDCTGGLFLAGSDTTTGNASLAAGTNNDTASGVTLDFPTGSTSGPEFVNGANETAVVAVDPAAIDSALDTTTYAGAVQDQNDTWWQGWACGLEESNPC